MKIYYPNVLDSIVKMLSCAFKVERVADVASLDQGGTHHPLVLLKERWSGTPSDLERYLRKAFTW